MKENSYIKKKIIVLDQQGPFGRFIRSLLPLSEEVTVIKKSEELLKFVEDKNLLSSLYLILVVYDDRDFISLAMILKYDISIIYAPTHKHTFEKISSFPGVHAVDISRDKNLLRIDILKKTELYNK